MMQRKAIPRATTLHSTGASSQARTSPPYIMAPWSTRTTTLCTHACSTPALSNSDKMLEQLKDNWLKSEKYRIIFLSMLCAAAIALLPLQKYMTLSRFQKYGMAIFAFGFGYLIQLAVSWRKLQKWARASSGATAV